MSSTEVRRLRHEIDRLDEQIVDIVARRLKCAADIQVQKRLAGRSACSPEREADILRRVSELGRQRGVDDNLMQEIFTRLFEACREHHLRSRS